MTYSIQRISTAGNSGKSNSRASNVGNRENGNKESRRYQRKENGQGVCPARANPNRIVLLLGQR